MQTMLTLLTLSLSLFGEFLSRWADAVECLVRSDEHARILFLEDAVDSLNRELFDAQDLVTELAEQQEPLLCQIERLEDQLSLALDTIQDLESKQPDNLSLKFEGQEIEVSQSQVVECWESIYA